MSCLYASDYGPPDPGFDAFADGGRLVQGFETHVTQLSHARNLGQLYAIERKLVRGEDIVWCDQGYGWAYGPPFEHLFAAIIIAVILPYAAWKTKAWPRRWLRLVISGDTHRSDAFRKMARDA